MTYNKIPLGKAEDLQGQCFGFLQALYRTNNIGKHTTWCCKCLRCGNLTAVRIDHLKEERVKSCGCYNKEVSAERIRATNYKGKNAKDITGFKSGYLEAIEPTEKRISYNQKDSRVVWKCLCRNPIHTEPTYCEATITALTSGIKKSCGCIKSIGEEKIKNLLLKNNISFEQQKSFDNCIFPNSGWRAYFDFYIEEKYLIEFDGKQHFIPAAGWDEPFENIKYRDNFKNEWCLKNGIPLIRIPYTHLNDIILEDLKLETSQYILQENNNG